MKKFLLTAVFALIGALVLAQERIAVFPFEDKENVLTRNEAAMLYRSFYTEFASRNAGRFFVVPRQEIERLISIEAAFIMDNFYTREKIAEIMQTQNATLILSGVISRSRNNIRISVSIYSYTKDYYPGIDQLPGRSILNAANTEELFNKIPELAQNMYNEISGAIVEPVPVGLEYEIVDGRTITITEYSGDATTLNIQSYINGLPVTSIGRDIGEDDNVFAGFVFSGDNLTSITIPSSVTSIGVWAFYGCSSLTSITVDNNNPAYASIDGVLFDKNIRTLIRYPEGRNQRTYVIPSSVTSIGEEAFSSCYSLTRVTIPSSVTTIGEGAFSGCTRLTSITLSRNTQISENAFPSSARITYRD